MDTRRRQMGRKRNKCLLCYDDYTNSSSFSKTSYHERLEAQLPVIFLLKKVLHVRDDVCKTLILKNGNPSTWEVDTCLSCKKIVVEAQIICDQIHQLERKLYALQTRCENKIKKSVENFPIKVYSRRCKSIKEILEPVDYIRHELVKDLPKNVVSNDISSRKGTKTTESEVPKSRNSSSAPCFVVDFKEEILINSGDDGVNSDMDNYAAQDEEDRNDVLNVIEEYQFISKPDISSFNRRNVSPNDRSNWDSENNLEVDCIPDLIYGGLSFEVEKEVVIETSEKAENSSNASDHGSKMALLSESKRQEKDYTVGVKTDNETYNCNMEVEDEEISSDHDEILQSESQDNHVSSSKGRWKLKSADKHELDVENEHLKLGDEQMICPFSGCDYSSSIISNLQAHKKIHLKRNRYELNIDDISSDEEAQDHQSDDEYLPSDEDEAQDHQSDDEYLPSDDEQVLSGSDDEEIQSESDHPKLKSVDQIPPSDNHLKVAGDPIKCPFAKCTYSSSNISDLQAHRSIHQSHYKTGKRLRSTKLTKQFKCNYCSKTFNMLRDLRVHKRKVHLEAEIVAYNSRRSCKVCNQTLCSSKNLKNHMARFHPNVEDIDPQAESNIPEEPQSPSNSNAETSEQEKNSNNANQNKSIKWVGLTTGQGPATCEFCGKSYPSARKCIDHIQMNHIKKTCNICGEELENHTRFMHHKRNAHGGFKRFQCEECPKGFMEFRNLSIHQAQSHGKPLDPKYTKYTCKMCGKLLSGMKSLKGHMMSVHRSSDVEKPFKCSYSECQFSSLTMSQLSVHKRYVHEGASRKKPSVPMPCSECKKVFYHKRSLQRHLKNVHKQDIDVPLYDSSKQCEQCGRVLKDKKSFLFHMNKKHGENYDISHYAVKIRKKMELPKRHLKKSSNKRKK